jgi:two-component system NtrC family sensor kinase
MQSDRFKHTRRVILIRVLLVPFVPVMLVFGTLVYNFATTLRSQVEAELVRIADGHRDLIEQFLRERSADLEYVAAASTFDELSGGTRLAEAFANLQTGSRAFFDLGVIDAAGSHVAYVGPYDLRGKNYAEAEWFRQVQQKPVYISDVFRGYRNIPHFVIAVRRQEGDRAWYLRATIDTLFFNDLVENIRVGKTGEAYLINQAGVLQTPRRSGGSLMEVDPDYVLYQAETGAIASFSASGATGGRYLYATGKLSPTGWLLVVRQEIGDAYAPLVRAVLIALALIAAGGVAVVSTGYLLASGVANRLTMADIEKRQMGNQLIMAGKLAEVGEMSAGIAHEINNPLQVMKSEEALIRDIMSDMEAEGSLEECENARLLRDSIDQIDHQIDRCKHIVQGLLRFARESEIKIQPVDVAYLMAQIVGMVERQAQVENIRIAQRFDGDLPSVMSDSGQLQQVFLNLLNNAMYALRKRDNAEIRITATQEDGTVVVAVADNGCGIAPENLEKIFLPFFTTKPVGQGTGLGLSTCFGIVENLGGQLSVTSELNVGSVFTVKIPVSGPAEGIASQLAAHGQGGKRR